MNNSSDKRYYVPVKFLSFSEFGLLEIGANVACIGSDLANFDFSKFIEFNPMKTWVKPADVTAQRVLGFHVC